MIPNYATYTQISNGNIEAGRFGLEATPIMYYNLMSGIARNKIKYVLQELGANAWDTKSKVDIFLPTIFKPQFRIRDNGPGLSHDAVVDIFTCFGKSTKHTDNDSQGHRGLGAKSPFAYLITGIGGAASFTVRSFHGGVVSTYVMSITPDGYPSWELKDQSLTSEPTGLEVSFAVRTDDVDRFRNEAYRIYWGFDPRPTIHPDINWPQAEVIHAGDGWTHYKRDTIPFNRPTVRMGCLLFTIDFNQLDKSWPWQHAPILFDVPLGSLTPTTSNEDLGYDTQTKATLTSTLEAFERAFIVELQDELDKCPNWFAACASFSDRVQHFNRTAIDYLAKRVLYKGKTPVCVDMTGSRENFQVMVFASAYRPAGFTALTEGRGKEKWTLSVASWGSQIKTVLVGRKTNRILDRLDAVRSRFDGAVLWIREVDPTVDALASFGLTRSDPMVIDLDAVKLPPLTRGPKVARLVKKRAINAEGNIIDVEVNMAEPQIYVVDKDSGSRYRNRDYWVERRYGKAFGKRSIGHLIGALIRNKLVPGNFRAIILTEHPTDTAWQPLVEYARPLMEKAIDFQKIADFKAAKATLPDNPGRLQRLAPKLTGDMPADVRTYLDKLVLFGGEADKPSDIGWDLYHDTYRTFVDNPKELPPFTDPAKALTDEYNLLREKYRLLHFIISEMGYWTTDPKQLAYYLQLEARAANS